MCIRDSLFGSGKSLIANLRRTALGESADIEYIDPQILDGEHRLRLAGGTTDDGPTFDLEFGKPLRHRSDPLAYGGSAFFRDTDANFFERGDTIAEVQFKRLDLRAFRSLNEGGATARRMFGFDAALSSTNFGSTQQAAGSTDPIRVPGDTTNISIGAFWQADEADEFRIERNLDSVSYTHLTLPTILLV